VGAARGAKCGLKLLSFVGGRRGRRARVGESKGFGRVVLIHEPGKREEEAGEASGRTLARPQPDCNAIATN